MKKKLILIGILVVLILGAIIYFRPLSFKDLIKEDEKITCEVISGLNLDLESYENLSSKQMSEILLNFEEYSYRRKLIKTNKGGNKSMNIFTYKDGQVVNIIYLSDTGEAVINDRLYEVNDATGLIESIYRIVTRVESQSFTNSKNYEKFIANFEKDNPDYNLLDYTMNPDKDSFLSLVAIVEKKEDLSSSTLLIVDSKGDEIGEVGLAAGTYSTYRKEDGIYLMNNTVSLSLDVKENQETTTIHDFKLKITKPDGIHLQYVNHSSIRTDAKISYDNEQDLRLLEEKEFPSDTEWLTYPFYVNGMMSRVITLKDVKKKGLATVIRHKNDYYYSVDKIKGGKYLFLLYGQINGQGNEDDYLLEDGYLYSGFPDKSYFESIKKGMKKVEILAKDPSAVFLKDFTSSFHRFSDQTILRVEYNLRDEVTDYEFYTDEKSVLEYLSLEDWEVLKDIVHPEGY
ncbi:hypothetical protein P261_02077 [Lachnospiraceae bacterium TWA4]|nr:hypothetical protein P261_02077 [Lachnospiraceae bacterium TWA4]